MFLDLAHKSTDPTSMHDITIHLIEQYARHNRHADIMRTPRRPLGQ